MKYSVELRMKNLGSAKYLIDSTEKNDLNEAFYAADEMSDRAGDDHVVQIRDEAGEVIASFGPGGSA